MCYISGITISSVVKELLENNNCVIDVRKVVPPPILILTGVEVIDIKHPNYMHV